MVPSTSEMAMLIPLLRGALPMILAGICALPLAHADIFTWTDESGRVNISNLTPPDGVRVTNVMHENKAAIAARDVAREAAQDALREAEVRVLAERVRQLQNEVEIARRPAPPQVEYRPIPMPVYVPYPVEMAAPPQYAATTSVANGGCGFGWPDCAFGWYPGIYPVNVIARPPYFRRDRDAPAPGRGHIAPWLPLAAPGGARGH
jgi:Domain of unknown function (DUF4124)